jgi:hypothetical protein
LAGAGEDGGSRPLASSARLNPAKWGIETAARISSAACPPSSGVPSIHAAAQDEALKQILGKAQEACHATFVKYVNETGVVSEADALGSGTIDICQDEARVSDTLGTPRIAERVGRFGDALLRSPVEARYRGTQRFRLSLAPDESEPPPPSSDGRYNADNPLWPLHVLSAIVAGHCDHRYDDVESAAIALRLARCDLENIELHPDQHKRRLPFRKPDLEIWVQVHAQPGGPLDEFRFSWSQRGRRAWFVYRYDWQSESASPPA